MTEPRSKFAGGDQGYLRDEQYRTSDRLATRAGLHEKYSTSAVNWFDWVSQSFGLRPSASVLEVGCGAGWLWQAGGVAVPDDVTLTLTDLSPGMVGEAVERVTTAGRLASVTGEPADAQALPFATSSFDRVIANHMLYHLPDPARGVAELARVLRRDGRAIVATNGQRHLEELWTIRREVFGPTLTNDIVENFGIDTAFPVLRQHFGSVGWHAFDDQLRCTDPADVVDYICSIPPAETATPDEHSAIEAAVARAFADGDGTMTISKDTGCFVCTDPRPTT